MFVYFLPNLKIVKYNDQTITLMLYLLTSTLCNGNFTQIDVDFNVSATYVGTHLLQYCQSPPPGVPKRGKKRRKSKLA